MAYSLTSDAAENEDFNQRDEAIDGKLIDDPEAPKEAMVKKLRNYFKKKGQL